MITKIKIRRMKRKFTLTQTSCPKGHKITVEDGFPFQHEYLTCTRCNGKYLIEDNYVYVKSNPIA